jgi:hypothetical protein
MGLIELARYYQQIELAGLLDSVEPLHALGQLILELERTRLRLACVLLRLKQLEEDLIQRGQHNERRIAQRERQIRQALASDADNQAQRSILGKRELIEIERELIGEQLAVRQQYEDVARVLARLVARIDEVKGLRRSLLTAERPVHLAHEAVPGIS